MPFRRIAPPRYDAMGSLAAAAVRQRHFCHRYGTYGWRVTFSTRYNFVTVVIFPKNITPRIETILHIVL